ncbi:hypothetical protein Tco_0474264 [Tanacetum coccineum]
MDNISEDIQCPGSDTRPPMLDRTDFASWQTTDIRCIGVKRNGHEAHFGANENKIGCWNDSLNTVDPLALMSNVAPQQYNSHSSTNPSSNRYMVFGRAQILSLGNANPGHASKLSATTATENGVALDEEHWRTVMLLFDVGEAPGHPPQTMFMANLSSADPVYDKSGPSYDSDILSKEPFELYEDGGPGTVSHKKTEKPIKSNNKDTGMEQCVRRRPIQRTDNAKIARKRSKLDKHGHGNG